MVILGAQILGWFTEVRAAQVFSGNADICCIPPVGYSVSLGDCMVELAYPKIADSFAHKVTKDSLNVFWGYYGLVGEGVFVKVEAELSGCFTDVVVKRCGVQVA